MTSLTRKATRDVWIGFSHERQEGKWEWVTGEGTTFTSWRRGEPDNSNRGGDFCNLPPKGGPGWNDSQGGLRLGFICEWEPGAAAEPTEAERRAPTSGERGLLGKYYAGQGFRKLVLRRVDPKIDFNWGGRPAPGMPKDWFSVRWEGSIVPPATGDYVFHLSADDSGQLWVAGRSLISADHRNPRSSDPVGLQAGKAVPVKLQLLEGMWDARMHFRWTGPGIPAPVPVPAECLRPPGAAAAATIDLTRGLVGHWKFDEGKGAIAHDPAGKGNDGKIVGARWVKGKIGGALAFDGANDKVVFGASDLDPPWSAAMWVKREAGAKRVAALMDSRASSLRLQQGANTGKLGFTSYQVDDYRFDVEAPVGVWAHLVFVGTPTGTSISSTVSSADRVPRRSGCRWRRL